MRRILIIVGLIFSVSVVASAQSTEFTYQGSLKVGTPPGTPANTPHDFEFRLFATETGGTLIGSPLTRSGVPVSNGSFSVKLDFGDQFPGASRYLEISVRPAGGGTFQQLLPRHLINSSPYSVKSLNAETAVNATSAAFAANATNAATATNALQLGGIAADQYVLTSDPRMSDPRPPLPGSSSYLQNSTGTQPGNFNLIGSGMVTGTLTATQFNIGPNRILSLFDTSLFVGRDSGQVPLPGFRNSFFGYFTGPNVGAGNDNSLFGFQAGQSVSGVNNNSYFGTYAGRMNNGSDNSFFGKDTGNMNNDINQGTFIGYLAGANAGGLTNVSAIGSRSLVSQSNSMVLGSINGQNGATADTNVGIGTTAPSQRLHVVGNQLISGNLNVGGTITGTFSGTIETANNALSLGGVPAGNYLQSNGNGSGLTNLNANSISSGTLGVARGGTGLTSAGSSGNFLRSNGSNWSSAALLAADIPTGSANYIQNGTSQQASSNFNISGTGSVGSGITVDGNNTNDGTASNMLQFGNASGEGIASKRNAGNNQFGLDFYTASTNRMSITNSGNVGIGTTTPIGNLHINIPGSSNPISALTVDVGTFGTGTNSINSYFFKVRDVGGGNTPAFMIRGDGNVGIATATPSDRFHVVGSSTFSGNVNINATAGVAGNLNVGGNGVFSGNLGIGIAPSSKLHISGAGIVRARINSDSNGGLQLGLNNQPGWSVATVDPGQFQIYNDSIGQNAVWIDKTTNNVAIGTTTTAAKLQVDGGNGRGLLVTTNNPGDYVAQFGSTGVFAIDDATSGGGRLMVLNNGTTQINIPGNNGETGTKLNVNGSVKLNMVPNAGFSVCWGVAGVVQNLLVNCGVSSIRYKDNVSGFSSGLDLVRRLRPVSFNWKSNGMHDIGLIAEEVAKEEPLLANYNAKGEVEGVKYDRIGVIAVNAIKEQQAQIETLEKKIRIQAEKLSQQDRQIAEMKSALCELSPASTICRP